MKYLKLFEGYLDYSYEKIDEFPSDIEIDEKKTTDLLKMLPNIIDEDEWDITPILYAKQIHINGLVQKNWDVCMWILVDYDDYYYVRYDDESDMCKPKSNVYGDFYKCDGKDMFMKLLKDKGVI